MEMNLVAEALKFMVIGMMTVFVFLVLMVLVLNLQRKIISRYFPTKAPSTPSRKQTSNNVVSDDAAVVAAIMASIQKIQQK